MSDINIETVKLTVELEDGFKKLDARIHDVEARKHNTTLLGSLQWANLISIMGLSYEESGAIMKARMQEKGHARNWVNKFRNFLAPALSDVIAGNVDQSNWPTVKRIDATLKHAKLTVGEFVNQAINGGASFYELDSSAVDAATDDLLAEKIEPTQERVDKRVLAMVRKSDGDTASTSAERTPLECVLAPLELHWESFTDAERQVIWNFRKPKA